MRVRTVLRVAIVAALLTGVSASGRLATTAPSTTTWTDLGFGLAGSQGVPQLSGTGSLLPGTPVSILLAGANAGIDAWLVVGLVAVYAPYKGGTLVPGADLIIPIVTSAGGTSQVDSFWPAGVPSGLFVYFQCWILDPVAPKGLSASNGLQAVTP